MTVGTALYGIMGSCKRSFDPVLVTFSCVKLSLKDSNQELIGLEFKS